MVNEAILYSTKALYEKDAQLARTVIEKDSQVDNMENFLKGSSLKYGIDVVSIATDDLISKKLVMYFREKKQRHVR